jgi:hypothetical protein
MHSSAHLLRFICTILILGDDEILCFIPRLIALHVLHLRLLAREEGNYAQLIKQMCWRYCIMLFPNVFQNLFISNILCGMLLVFSI